LFLGRLISKGTSGCPFERQLKNYLSVLMEKELKAKMISCETHQRKKRPGARRNMCVIRGEEREREVLSK
jgi:hypothetical protein